MSRKEVYKRIDEERNYQDSFIDDMVETPDGMSMAVGEEILLIEEYIAKARTEWTNDFTQPEVSALHMIRKIAGICVRCMENHGAPKR